MLKLGSKLKHDNFKCYFAEDRGLSDVRAPRAVSIFFVFQPFKLLPYGVIVAVDDAAAKAPKMWASGNSALVSGHSL